MNAVILLLVFLAVIAATVATLRWRQRIRKLEATRRDFVANVSHELRTPISVIKGYVETLLDDPPPDPETARKFLQTIQNHSAQLEALINDLLDLSALESQQAKLNFETVSLRTVAQADAIVSWNFQHIVRLDKIRCIIG